MFKRPYKEYNSIKEPEGFNKAPEFQNEEEFFEPISTTSRLNEEDNSCDKMSKIIQFPNGSCIYISGLDHVVPPDFVELKENNIGTVITVMDDLSVIIPPQYKQYFFKAMDTPTENINVFFDYTWTIISQALNNRENILVHCRAGISRSVTLVIAFLLKCLQQRFPLQSFIQRNKQENWSQAILRFIRSKRGCVNPNMGFMLQLYDYEQKLKLHLYMSE